MKTQQKKKKKKKKNTHTHTHSAWDAQRIFFQAQNTNTLLLRIGGVTYIDDAAQLADLRDVEIEEHVLSSGDTRGAWDVKSSVVEVAAMQAGLTTFIVLLLAVGAALFARDANRLVIAPIERMVGFVKQLADNPASAVPSRKLNSKKKKKKLKKQDETSVIEQALAKIATLLQIGFGEAGAAIITKNLQSGDQLNAMVPGEKMRAVFGFCDIRNFTDTTECLQEAVMPFTNMIADIVHTAVKENYGAPNKNIGDAFLLVWKLPDGTEITVPGAPSHQDTVTAYCDGALRSFLRIIDEIEASEELKRMVDIPSIRKRMPNYKVKMGFGLHLGWGIEGAIGSMLKIDASYLSPHVNLAARLESGTKMYGKELLLSDAFVRELSPAVREELRRIDRVTVKGSIEPMVLYTYDIETPRENDGTFTTYEKYRDLFHHGYDEYVKGNWGSAGGIMERCLRMWPNDEPARGILWYMSRSNFRAPASWEGFRALDSK
jgi:class 3 adenylate cyclase